MQPVTDGLQGWKNYNFWLHYQDGKANIDADALLRVSWSGCIPDDSGTHLQVTAAAVWAVQEVALKGLASPIKAYSYDLHILDTVQDSQQVTCMTLEDWHQAQQEDPTLSLAISRLQDGTLGQQWYQPIHPNLDSSCVNTITCCLNRVSCTDEPDTGNLRRPSFSWFCPSTQREVVLKGCHNEVGHLGMECMLNLMCDRFLLASHGCSGKRAHW